MQTKHRHNWRVSVAVSSCARGFGNVTQHCRRYKEWVKEREWEWERSNVMQRVPEQLLGACIMTYKHRKTFQLHLLLLLLLACSFCCCFFCFFCFVFFFFLHCMANNLVIFCIIEMRMKYVCCGLASTAYSMKLWLSVTLTACDFVTVHCKLFKREKKLSNINILQTPKSLLTSNPL